MTKYIFNKIELSDKEVFDKFLKEYPPQISDLLFSNIFCWKESKKYTYTIIDEHLLISYLDKEGNKKFFQPIGKNPDMIIKKILDEYPKNSFERVDERIALSLKDDLDVTYDRDNSDYVYDIKELSELKGTKYAPKRNFVYRCERLNPTVVAISQENIKECISLHETWCKIRKCDEDDFLSAEDMAIRQALNNFDNLGLMGIAVIIKEKIRAFAIGEKLNLNTYVEHFERGDTEYPGTYQYVLYMFSNAIPKYIKYLNREQDLGLEGIRKAKESYHPITLINKYIVKKS